MVDFKLLQPQPGGVFPGFPGCHVNFSATSFQSHPRPSISFKWVIPKLGEPQNGWFVMENPIKMDDLGVPLFSETSKSVFFCSAGTKTIHRFCWHFCWVVPKSNKIEPPKWTVRSFSTSQCHHATLPPERNIAP